MSGRAGQDRDPGAVWNGARIVALWAVALGLGCTAQPINQAHVARPGEDAYDVVTRVDFRGGAVGSRQTRPLAPGYTRPLFVLPPSPLSGVGKAPPKLHPDLVPLLSIAPVDRRETLLVTLRETVHVPRFPFAKNVSDTSHFAAARRLADSLHAVRRTQIEADTTGWARRYGAQVLHAYWLSPTVLVSLPVNNVNDLASHERVVFLRHRRANERPPAQVCGSGKSPHDARQDIGSDPYVEAGLGEGLIAMLDTGVRSSHVLLDDASMTRFHCPNQWGCNGTDVGDELDGHGTSTAGILVGNDSLDNCRGMTNASIRSYRVYEIDQESPDYMELVADAVPTAFQIALASGARIILAEIDANEPVMGPIASAAENAYQSGAVVIAANGNLNRAAGSPALARRVLGIGAYGLGAGTQSYSSGITGDLRTKPDLLAPTDTETAGNENDTDIRSYGATSGAAPYAAGAALLAWNLLRGEAPAVDPGLVYAYLILSGQQTGSMETADGAGRIVLPFNCWLDWGKVQLEHGEQVEIDLDATGLGIDAIEAAIWWPEPPHDWEIRNNVDLFLISDEGEEFGSTSEKTVFERLRASVSPADGDWRLRIVGKKVSGGEFQDVYWTVAYRLPD